MSLAIFLSHFAGWKQLGKCDLGEGKVSQFWIGAVQILEVQKLGKFRAGGGTVGYSRPISCRASACRSSTAVGFSDREVLPWFPVPESVAWAPPRHGPGYSTS